MSNTAPDFGLFLWFKEIEGMPATALIALFNEGWVKPGLTDQPIRSKGSECFDRLGALFKRS
jgi:hypothetical protein